LGPRKWLQRHRKIHDLLLGQGGVRRVPVVRACSARGGQLEPE
jgi:hypothetical protein